MKRFWMLAFVAAFGVAACDTAPETADADDAMEEAALEETVDDMAMATPALGDYTLAAREGGNPEMVIGEEDVANLNIAESTWTATLNGEPVSNGTWVAEEGRLRVTYESGDCAGQEAIYDLNVGDTGFTMDLIESTCELAATHLEYTMAGGDTMDHGAMDEEATDEEAMDEGGTEDGGEM